MKNISEQQAYSAMFYFLKQWYKRTNSDELGGMLGDLSLLPDGSPADPAVRQDWIEAVEYAIKGGTVDPLRLS